MVSAIARFYCTCIVRIHFVRLFEKKLECYICKKHFIGRCTYNVNIKFISIPSLRFGFVKKGKKDSSVELVNLWK